MLAPAAFERADVERLRLAATRRLGIENRDLPQLAVRIDQQIGAVRRRVRPFEDALRGADHHGAAELVFGLDHLERRPGRRPRDRQRRRRFELHIRELHDVGRVHVVRGQADAGIEFAVEMQRDARAHAVQRLAMEARQQRDRVAALLQPHRLRRAEIDLDVLRIGALLAPVLQRRRAVAMRRDIDVDAVRIERLAEHQKRLAMRDRVMAIGDRRPGHVGLQRHVAADLLPEKMEVVLAVPEVRAGGSQRIDAARRIEPAGARRVHAPDIGLRVEQPERLRARRRHGQRQQKRQPKCGFRPHGLPSM